MEAKSDIDLEYTLKRLSRISDLNHEMLELEKALVQKKDQIREFARQSLEEAPRARAGALFAWAIYWEYHEIPVQFIYDHYEIKVHEIGKIFSPYEESVNCYKCRQDFTVTFRSRQHMKDSRPFLAYTQCPTCKELEKEQERLQYALQSQELERRKHAINELQSMPYEEYLKTDHWKSVRSSALKRASYKCQVCNTDKVTLHVHHRTYINRGDEKNDDVIVLCADCHKVFHDNGKVQS